MRNKPKRSVFFRYLMSNLSIVALTLTIIGLAQILYFLAVLDRLTIQTLNNKMELVLQDMDTQWDELAGVATAIQISPAFNPHLMKDSKYADIELLQELVKFTHNSVYSGMYFLLYNGSESVYLCDSRRNIKGSVLSFRYCCQYMLEYGAVEALYANLQQTGQAGIIRLGQDPARFLLTFPVHTTGAGDLSGNATLCFVTTGNDILNRAQDVSGGFNGSLTLRYHDLSLAGPEQTETREWLTMTGQDGNFRIAVDTAPERVGNQIFGTSGLNVWILLALLLLVLGAAGILAYYNYLPIQQLFAKYVFSRNGKRGLPASNELKEIDSTLRQILDSNQNMNEQLQAKMDLLKAQILRLVLNGEYTPEMRSRLEMINVSLPGPYYCAFELLDKTASQERPIRDLMPLIEDLSDEDARIYAVENENETGLSILTSLSEQDLKADISDNILALCDAENRGVRLVCGRICKSLQTVHISLLDARSAALKPDKAPENVGKTVPLRTGFPLDCDWSDVDRFINAVTAGDDSALTEKLAAVGQLLQQNEADSLRLKYLYTDIAGRLVRTAHSLNIPLNEQQVNLLFWARGTDDFLEGLHDLTQDIFRKNNSPIHDDNLAVHRRAKEIQRFIQEHAMDYDISLDSIAAHFAISVSGVGRLIKSVSGKNFKEYLIELRMAEAKNLLSRTDLTVSEICRRVGYTNNSNFIKNFKREAGVTPMNYKKITEEDQTC